MSRSPARSRQTDLVRGLKAASACGLTIARTEIAPEGRLILVLGEIALPIEPVSELEARRAKRSARACRHTASECIA